MNEITQWLAAPDKDYQAGLKLLKRLSPENKKMQFLASCSSAVAGSLHFNILEQEVKYAFRIHLANGTLNKVQSPLKPIVAGPLDTTKRKFVFNDIVDVKTLPPELQKLYFRNQEITRSLAGLHQELKAAASDSWRKELAEKISALNQERITNWKQLDEFSEGIKPAGQSSADSLGSEQKQLLDKISAAQKEIQSGSLSKNQITHRKRMITLWKKKLQNLAKQ